MKIKLIEIHICLQFFLSSDWRYKVNILYSKDTWLFIFFPSVLLLIEVSKVHLLLIKNRVRFMFLFIFHLQKLSCILVDMIRYCFWVYSKSQNYIKSTHNVTASLTSYLLHIFVHSQRWSISLLWFVLPTFIFPDASMQFSIIYYLGVKNSK